MIAIYTPYNNARIQYVFALLFDWYSKNIYQIFTNKKTFLDCIADVKISYAKLPETKADFSIYNVLYLEKADVKNIKVAGKGENFRLFPAENTSFDINYDLPAMLYYLLARVEEINAPESCFDQHQRFSPKYSLAAQHGFLEIPLLDICILVFLKKLQAAAPNVNLPDTQTTIIPTIDLDNGFAFKGKSFSRRFLGAIRQIVRLENPLLKYRFFAKTDALDTYKEQSDFFKQNNISPLYFVQCSHGGKYNQNMHPDNPFFSLLVKKLPENIGLHPSYQRLEQPPLLIKEKKILTKVCGKDVNKVRQHFIRFQVQEYYPMLEKSDFILDYSMGYATAVGFRASTAKPYPFFNHLAGQPTGIIVHPFCCMDGTFIHSLKMDVKAAKEKMYMLFNNVQEAGGEFYFIWHDRYLSRLKSAKSWKTLFYEFLKDASVSQTS